MQHEAFTDHRTRKNLGQYCLEFHFLQTFIKGTADIHFSKDLRVVSCFTHCRKFFTHLHTCGVIGGCIRPVGFKS
jgi:hypothetical protein